jgi:hypothetical protein
MTGYVAYWQGEEYPASPALEGDRLTLRLYRTEPADGFRPCGTGRYVRVVPVSEADQLWYLRDVCDRQGEPCYVLTRDDTRGVLLESPEPVDGFTRVAPGVYRRWAAPSEVGPVRVERTPVGQLSSRAATSPA